MDKRFCWGCRRIKQKSVGLRPEQIGFFDQRPIHCQVSDRLLGIYSWELSLFQATSDFHSNSSLSYA